MTKLVIEKTGTGFWDWEIQDEQGERLRKHNGDPFYGFSLLRFTGIASAWVQWQLYKHPFLKRPRKNKYEYNLEGHIIG